MPVGIPGRVIRPAAKPDGADGPVAADGGGARARGAQGGGGAAGAEGGEQSTSEQQQQQQQQQQGRAARVAKLLAEPVVSLPQLRELAWSGLPAESRPDGWRVLTGYVPPGAERAATLQRKRAEYSGLVRMHWEVPAAARSEDEDAAARQIALDVPRTSPGVDFLRHAAVQAMLSRLLYIRAVRSVASGYVQGMNDLAAPFLAVFLAEACGAGGLTERELEAADGAALAAAEADSYWCFCKLLDRVQTLYTFAQPGVQEMVFAAGAVVARVDAALAEHLEAAGLQYIQFAFRWGNCLMLREVPFALAARMWDTFLAEGEGLAEFAAYVIAAFLLRWSKEVRELSDFQGLVRFLQSPPSIEWGAGELESLLAQAHQLRSSFGTARAHLQ